MDVVTGRGDFIDGAFKAPTSPTGEVQSRDPARDFAPVCQAATSAAHVELAIAAARAAQPGWHALGVDGRKQHLLALKAAFDESVEPLARAITREMGKPIREATAEAKSLGERITLMLDDGLKRIAPLRPDGVNGEARWHPQGVLAVVGPYNFPAHLVNAHVIPALVTGNTVVVKPSEVTPLSGELYAAAVANAGLPNGVFNMVQGGADVGRALVAHAGVDGVLFTGSYQTGRAITAACLDQPHKILALEMGGKNAAVVLDDADLPQALAAVLQGAFLSAGQRCTATSRLLVEKKIAERFLDALLTAARELRPGDPLEPSTAMGPLASKEALERFVDSRKRAVAAGCVPLLSGSTMPGGAFVTPSIHLLPEGRSDAPGYLDVELFGPDLCVEVVQHLDHAIERVNALPFGLSNAIFTIDQTKFERFFTMTKSGLVNWNRSTNGASGKLPFGGVGKSGNQRAAGIDAPRYTTFPVAILKSEPGEIPVEQPFLPAVKAGEERLKLAPDRLVLRHAVERLLERHRVYFDDVRGPDLLVPLDQLTDLSVGDNLLEPEDVVTMLAPFATLEDSHVVITVPAPKDDQAAAGPDVLDVVNRFLGVVARENPVPLLRLPNKAVRRPPGGHLPRSEAMLRRLYRGDFVPREKKEPVVDHSWCDGPFLSSIDDDSLVVLDAGSQIASVGLGFNAGTFLRALDDGELGEALIANPETQAPGADRRALDEYARSLLDQAWDGLRHCSFTASGAEATEKALDLCRMHGPGGRRVVAFQGSFHGRTLAALHATHSPQKRGPFELPGYEAAFVPFPTWLDPREEPPVEDAWIAAWTTGKTPAGSDESGGDPLLRAEIASLLAVREQLQRGDVCCVIAEPMQGEGGDNFATARFFNGLRALTRGAGVPLVFDEVQTGFGLGGPFWWHTLFSLRDARGKHDGPDCVTTAKKAQVGACLSVWPDPRPASAHVAQVLRGHLHARGILLTSAREIETEVQERLWALAVDYPALVMNPRNEGWSFAFDLPSAHLANQLVAQRFYRGFMAYPAGEKTMRFRLNAAWTTREVEMLFAGLREALNAIAGKARGVDPSKQREAIEAYVAPKWEDGATRTGEPARTSGGPFAVNYDAMSEDPPALLRWMTRLPRGPLEKVCDRVLSMEGQFEDDVVRAAMQRLVDASVDLSPSRLLDRFRLLSDEIDRAADRAVKYDALTEQLGMEPVRLLAEALGARVYVLTPSEWDLYKGQIVTIENATYEEGRRDAEEDLRRMVTGDGGIGVVLMRRTDIGPKVLGYAFGGPVEHYKSDGPRDDAMNGRGNTFYSANITVAPGQRGSGLGQRLKSAQVMAVGAVTDAAGAARYMFMTGRNRVGHTREMARINRLFGAYVVEHFRGNQYGDRSGQALYYRIPLRRPLCPTALPEPRFAADVVIDWASSVQMPLGPRHPRLVAALRDGAFTRAVGTKLTLSNWATPDVVRYAETLMHFGPKGLGHAYFTSSRDECVDKAIRALKLKRPRGELVIGLERQYVGHTTAAARSLSDPAGQAQPFSWFDWPKVPHPAEVGAAATLAAIRAVLERASPERVLGVFVELLGERSGLVLPDDFVVELAALRDETGVPIVAIETASSLGRMGPNLWASDGMRLKPNLVLWFAGGQLGHVFADDATYMAKPLTLISTWDGDEVSILRAQQHLLEARALLKEGRGAAFARRLDDADLRVKRAGAALWQVLDLGDEGRADALRSAALRRGLRLGVGLPGRVVLAPALGVADAELEAGVQRLQQALGEVA